MAACLLICINEGLSDTQKTWNDFSYIGTSSARSSWSVNPFEPFWAIWNPQFPIRTNKARANICLLRYCPPMLVTNELTRSHQGALTLCGLFFKYSPMEISPNRYRFCARLLFPQVMTQYSRKATQLMWYPVIWLRINKQINLLARIILVISLENYKSVVLSPLAFVTDESQNPSAWEPLTVKQSSAICAVYWHVSLLTYTREERYVLAANACTKANGWPWIAACFPVGSVY